MKKETLSHVSESVADYIYNANLFSQVEIMRENFGVDVEVDVMGEIVFEGAKIEDSQFDDIVINVIENMSISEIVDFWSEMNGVEARLSDDGTEVELDDDGFQTFNEAPYGK
jgi:hypothetical protein